MTLIKQVKAERLVKSALVLDLGDLQRQGEQIIERARREAEETISAAEKRAAAIDAVAGERGYAEGQVEGFREGREEGRQQGHAEVVEELKPQIEAIVTGWTAALDQWEADRNEMLLAARGDVLRFAIAMAEKVIYRELELDPTVIESQLREALALVVHPTSIRVVINPEDRRVVDEALDKLRIKIGSCEHVRLEEDSEVTRGGCMVTTAGGSIDATIGTQIQQIVQALLPPAEAPAEPEPPGPPTAEAADDS